MSYQLSFKASKCTLGSASAKAVLRCLCDYADDKGTNCRPSTDTISIETEFDRRTVFKAIAFLSSNDWIRVYKNGRGSRNFYALNVQKISNAFEQSRILKERFYAESSDNFVTSNKNDTEAVTFLHFHSDKNDTQLSQYSVNTQSDIYTNEKQTQLATDSQGRTIHDLELGEIVPPELLNDYATARINSYLPEEKIEGQLPAPEQAEVVEIETSPSKPETVEKSKSCGLATKTQASVTKPADVSEDLWADFLKHRKQKKAPVTDRVISLIRNEAKNAGWTLEEALNELILRNWTGFKSEWVEAKDHNAVWVKAEDYLPELPPVEYATTARDRFDQIMAKSTYAYDIKDLSQLERVVKKEGK